MEATKFVTLASPSHHPNVLMDAELEDITKLASHYPNRLGELSILILLLGTYI